MHPNGQVLALDRGFFKQCSGLKTYKFCAKELAGQTWTLNDLHYKYFKTYIPYTNHTMFGFQENLRAFCY